MTAAVALGPVRPPTNKWLTTVSITFGTLMGAIDSSIVNVAMPHIRGALGATVQEITWITTSYAIALVVVMPLTAFLGRMFGQKRVYVFSLVVFLAGSALCGIANSLVSLVVFRLIQGLGAGALQPTEQAILRQTFPQKEQGMAMAIFAMAVMIGPAVGPTLGGYIVDRWHWSWIFFINLPVGMLGLFMVTTFVQEDEEIRKKNQALAAAQRKHVDWVGISLLAVGLITFQYFLEEGQRDDWFESALMTTCFFVAIIAFAAFVIRELTTPVPAVNLRLFKDPVFASGTFIGGLMFAMLMASMFLLPLFMQEVLGFTATDSGLALMPRVLVMMVVTPFIGRLYNHVSPRIFIALGIVLVSLGSYEFSGLTLAAGSGDIVVAIMIQGAGFACLFVPLTTLALSKIQRHQLPDATGLNSLVRQLGGAIGVAVFATVLGNHETVATTGLASRLAVSDPQVHRELAQASATLAASGLDQASATASSVAFFDATVQRQVAVLSYEWVFVLTAIVFLCALPLVLLLREGRTDGPRDLPVEL